MAFDALTTGETDADSPADATLWGKVKANFDAIWGKFNATTGHKHTGAADDAPAIDALAASAFSVHKNGTNQTGVVTATWTKVTWETERFDENDDFDIDTNERFTPTIAGKYIMTGSISITTGGVTCAVAIYKNGTILMSDGTDDSKSLVAVVVDANGSSDYFELYVLQSSGSDKIIDGASSLTYFTGGRVS